MTPTLSERARELGAWLRGNEQHYRDVAHRYYKRVGGSRLKCNAEISADIYQSRAECVESLLAENARLRAELEALRSPPKLHRWIRSNLGHGETMCEWCCITNREAAVLGMLNVCQSAPAALPPPSPQGETE